MKQVAKQMVHCQQEIRMPDDAMTRREFLAVAGTGAVGLTLFGAASCRRSTPDPVAAPVPAPAPAAAAVHPNIFVILADDLGYAELGCQGCKDIATPNIDSIARGGVRFTNGYVTCPICAPTRAGLLTGRYQQRFGFETNPGPEQFADDRFGLPLDQATLAERLKACGYATGMFGKWHLGYKPELTPPGRGFDEFYGFLSGAHNYLPDSRRGDLFGLVPGAVVVEAAEVGHEVAAPDVLEAAGH